MTTKNIEQETILPCTPDQAFSAWLDSKQHGEMVGGSAKIDPKVGGTFTIWDDYLSGTTLEIDSIKHRIVQSWRDNSTDWPEDHFSKITIEFVPHDNGQCKVHFSQKNIPEKHVKSIAKGWEDYYWKPMKDYFSKS